MANVSQLQYRSRLTTAPLPQAARNVSQDSNEQRTGRILHDGTRLELSRVGRTFIASAGRPRSPTRRPSLCTH
jgi:hypothetical protein